MAGFQPPGDNDRTIGRIHSFVVSEGGHRGPLAEVGTARDLAIAPRARQNSRKPVNARLVGPHAALAGATAERAGRLGATIRPGHIMRSFKLER